MPVVFFFKSDMAYQAIGAEVSRLSLSMWGFLFTSWRDLAAVLMLAAASVSGLPLPLVSLYFFLPVSLSFSGNFFLNKSVSSDFSVVIHCDYAGAYWGGGGAGEQRHSIILWLNLRPFSAWIWLFLFFRGLESMDCTLQKCLSAVFLQLMWDRKARVVFQLS